MPQEVHGKQELWVHRLADEPEPGLLERAVALLQIALEAGRHDVDPGGLPAPGPRHHVVDRQLLAPAAAVLARVAVAAEDVLLVERDALEQRLSDIGGETDHRGKVEGPGGGPDHPRRGLDDVRFTAQQQGDGALGVREVQRLVGEVEHEDRDFIHIPRQDSDRPLPVNRYTALEAPRRSRRARARIGARSPRRREGREGPRGAPVREGGEQAQEPKQAR